MAPGYIHPQPQMLGMMGVQTWMKDQSMPPPPPNMFGSGYPEGQAPFDGGNQNGNGAPNGGGDSKKPAQKAPKGEVAKKSSRGMGGGDGPDDNVDGDEEHFKVYWGRWIMLMYMSLLNLLVSTPDFIYLLQM